MDWLTFKFCVLILVCVSKARSKVLNSTSSLSRSNQSQSACEEDQPVPSPDECNSCICFAGLVYCSNSTCAEQECTNDEEIPQPDPCNKCICRRGKVTCTNMICIPAPNCVEKLLYPSQNECNACMCLNGYISCTSNGCTAENWSNATTTTTTTTRTPGTSKKCIEGSRLPGPNKCVECSCVNGKKKCTNICTPSAQLENRFGDTSKRNECVSGQSIPKPDDCNNCICFEGEVHCTHRPCHTDMREGQECRDDQPVFQPDECNECYCFAGKLQCSDVVCIRGSKCVHDQEIPQPDSCNACKCIGGHILCTNNPCPALDTRNAFTPGSTCVHDQEIPQPDSCNACKCIGGQILCTNNSCPALDTRNAFTPERSSTEVTVVSAECQDGDVMPPLPPPYECNTCFCIEKKILCTMISCVDSDPEIKGRLKEENEPNHLQMFDKKISVEPFIEILYKNNDKIPTKVIHTHAYNGFHQEIKVHANHLPKDATGLLKALATSLDNSALASISQKLLTSSDSLSNNQEVNKNNLLGEGNMFTTQSSKLIASGSQSNETILVIPNTESFGSEYPPSLLPLADKHETIWKTVSVPASTVYHDNQLVQPRNSQEENLNVYLDKRPPIIHSIQHSDMIRNPSKFNRPGLPRTFPINPKPDTLELSNVNTLPNPMLNPTPININSGNINYAPLYQENNQFKQVPPGFGSKPTLPGHTPIFNYTLPSSGYGPGKHIATPNVNSGQQKQSQPQFVPNPTKYYLNQVKPQAFQFKPNQKRPSHIIITNSNNKGMQYPPLFLNTPNQPIVSVNQYNPSQFGLKPGQGNFLNNIGNQTDQNFKQISPNFQIPPVINLPEQNKRISEFEIQASKEKPINSKSETNSPQKGVNFEHTQQKPIHSQYVPNPSIYYKHEYEAPKINEINPDEEQLLPHSKLPSTFTERYNKSHTYSEPDLETSIPKVRNKTKKYNTTHSHYEKHTSVTYLSNYDPDNPVHPKIVGDEPNQDHNAPQTNEFDHYLPDQESQELDSTISKVIPLDQKDYPKPNHYNPSQTMILNEPDGSQSPRNSDEYPAHLKSNEHLHRPSQTGSIQNQPPRFQYAHNANQEPLEQKPINKLSTPGFESPQNNHLPGMLDERGSADGFQYPSNFAEDPTHYDPAHPKDNLHITHQSQLAPTQDKHKPGMIDNHGIKDGYQYAHNANQNPVHLKPTYELSDFLFSPTSNQQKPETLDDDGSSGGFKYPSNNPQKPQLTPNQIQYPSKSADHLLNPKGQTQIPLNSLFRPTQNQKLPEVIEDRGSAGGFRYPSNSAEKLKHPTDYLHNSINPNENSHRPFLPLFDFIQNKYSPNFHYPTNTTKNIQQPNSLYGPIQNQHLPEIFEERGSPDGFQYPSHSVENPSHKKQPNSLYGPTQNQLSPGISNDLGSLNGFQYPSHPAENPSHQKQPNSLYVPTQKQHSPGITDDRGSVGGFQYPSHSGENPSYQKQPNSLYGPTQNQHSPGINDDRGSAGGFQYPSHPAENPSYQKQPNSLYGPTQNQHSPGISDDRGSAGGFQYPSNSVENPSHQKQPNPPYGPNKNQHSPGIPDGHGSGDNFQYPSHSAENPSHQKQPNSLYGPTHNQHSPEQHSPNFQYPTNSTKNIQQPNSLYGPIQNQHLPEIFEERGSPNGFQYPSHSAENPSHQKQPNSPYGSTKNQHLPEISDDRGFTDGFQYPSHPAENPSHQKQPNSLYGPTHNQHSPGLHSSNFQYPTNSTNNIQQPNSLYKPIQNQHLPEIFKEQGSPNSFQYPSHSAENPSHQKQPNSSYGSTKNQHLPEISDDRGSADGFQYPSHPPENYSHQKQPISFYGPTQNQHSPVILDERGSADGFQYPSHSAENPSHQKQPNSPYGPAQNQHSPGILDERGSVNGFQYPSHSTQTTTTHPKDSPFDYIQDKHLIEIFGERGSPNGFQYPSHSTESPLQIKDNRHRPLQYQFLPSHDQYKDAKKSDSLFSPDQNKHLPAMFNENGPSDGFQYPSHSVESPLQTKDNRHHPLQSQFLPSHNQYKDTIHKQPDSIFSPNQNKHSPGMFDEHGSPDGFQYPSHSVGSPLQTKDNRHHPLQSQFLPSHNQYKNTIHKQPDSSFGTTNKHPAEDPANSKAKLSHSPVTFTHNQHSPSFYYPSHSAENLLHPNEKQPNSPYGLTKNQYLPTPFDKQQSSTAENPTSSNANIHNVSRPHLYPTQKSQNNSVHKKPEFPFNPTQIHDLPEVFEEVSQSTEDPTYSKHVPDKNPISKLTPKIYDKEAQPDQMPDLHPISPTSNNYNNNNPLRPWIHLDHDQYKPSSFDNLLNGIHNIPWSLPEDHKEMSNIVLSTPQAEFGSDRDQNKPLSLDNLHNGVHDFSLPEHHEKVLNTITSAPKARLKPEHDQYKPWSYDNSLNGIHQIPWPIPNQDSDVLVTDAEITTPRYTNSDNTQFDSRPETKPDSDPDNVLPIDDDEISNDYDQLYPLLNIVKKLSELPFNESALTVDQLDLLPKLLSGITKALNPDPNPENDHNNALPVENNDFQKKSPWSKIKSKFKQLPISGNGMLNWLKNKLNKIEPIKNNITAIIKDIDMTKIFNLLTKLKGPKINDNAGPQNISFSSFDFQEETLTTTSLPRTNVTHSYENRIKNVPIEHEENRTQASPVKYPDVHIILHQPNDQNDLDLPPFIETDGLGNLATDINSEELGTLFPKKFNPRFRHRPKDQKEECGDGTYWVSNCHGCSCYFGQPICFKIPDCKLRSFGEPMSCKPYSHFKMGCYTCECNGDGVAECDAKDCEPKLSGESIVSETTTIRPPESNEFFDSKKTDEILQYYYTYKKLPKYCPKTQHPTCEPGTSWISSCHKCECNESGKHECIKIDGCKLDFESYGKPSRCKPNSKFYPKTNSVPCVECSCDDEGKSHCPSAEQKH